MKLTGTNIALGGLLIYLLFLNKKQAPPKPAAPRGATAPPVASRQAASNNIPPVSAPSMGHTREIDCYHQVI